MSLSKIILCSFSLLFLFKPAAQSYAGSDKDLCLMPLIDRALWSAKITPLAELNHLSLAQKISELNYRYDNNGLPSWDLSLVPLKLNQGSVNGLTHFSNEVLYSNQMFQSDTVKTRKNVEICLVAELKERASDLATRQKAMIAATCGKLAISDTLSCLKGVEDLYRNARSTECIYTATNYALRWMKIIKDRSVNEVIEKIASSLLIQLKSKNISDLNLLDTVKKELEIAHISNAEDKAWDIIMMVANGAQDIHLNLRKLGAEDNIIASFKIMSHAQGMIDFGDYRTLNSSYSFPSEITGHCQTTKPYHFWMAAYQARDLVKKGFSLREAMMSVLTFAKAYHVAQSKDESDGGNPFRKDLALIFQMPFDHPTVSVIRHDLTLNILGAAYGAGQLRDKTINIESLFEKVFKARPKVGDLDYKTKAVPLAKNQVKSFMFWERMFNPDGIFKIVENEIRNAK